ncbi:MAG: chorismate-binding protein [Planctomycetota bacterium]
MLNLTREAFAQLVEKHRHDTDKGRALAVPIATRLLADQLTPVLAYRRLVAKDKRTEPSFLLESVEGGERQGRYSILGAHPARLVTAAGRSVTITNADGSGRTGDHDHPLDVVKRLTSNVVLVRAGAAELLPDGFVGGWFGYAGYDTVRANEPEKLGRPPNDDRGLPDLAFALHDGVIVFDHVKKYVHIVRLAVFDPTHTPGVSAVASYDAAVRGIHAWRAAIDTPSKPLAAGVIGVERRALELRSNTPTPRYTDAVARALEYIRAGDVFQVVLGQRFERSSPADPFDVYRALRAVNPSPYMGYMQTPGCILVAASPEILCRVRREGGGVGPTSGPTSQPSGKPAARVVTNRPLAGTRPRGQTPTQDDALAIDLLADEKERSEHAMLVDLARNDVGRVAKPGTIRVGPVMEVERYSHVMHISSTVTGELREHHDCWDALAAALPVGTVSGAPKIRAMQIIDELEAVKRGPYGGGFGYIGLDGDMDIALALRTIVVPTTGPGAPRVEGGGDLESCAGVSWTYHVQSAAGVVADSDPDAEHAECVNKARAMARAIDLAETAFGEPTAPAR